MLVFQDLITTLTLRLTYRGAIILFIERVVVSKLESPGLVGVMVQRFDGVAIVTTKLDLFLASAACEVS